MNRQCEHCSAPLAGRSDKRFCSVKCKNDFNTSRRRETRLETREVDRILHRNREIFQTIMGEKRNKMTIARLELIQMGFNFDYLTGVYTNKQGKRYHNVYDFAWMAFSTQEILIVRRKRT
ncbi:MAG: hypothetical protein H6557_03795 [Lewinellaceae bacterium]|nr:hypothetical protein [Phaeodactylibacter sp.]MCB9035721.1 hypothetical protein [Lewinellaceae bacterium]MCB9267899.1 hypothetical protein [Lewinellaceae bacterium]